MSNVNPKTPGAALSRWGGYLFAAIGALHIAVFVPHPYWSDWLTGGLWDGRAPGDSMIGFWALPGGFAPLGIVFGILVARMARKGQYIPAYLGWSVFAWAVGNVYLLGPSGFVTLLVPAGLLIAGNHAARRAARSTREEALAG